MLTTFQCHTFEALSQTVLEILFPEPAHTAASVAMSQRAPTVSQSLTER